jgi:hypothetical protein
VPLICRVVFGPAESDMAGDLFGPFKWSQRPGLVWADDCDGDSANGRTTVGGDG